jgi:hypothetical protein
MPSKAPRFLPTVALAVLWLALYFVWVAVRPTEPATTTRTRGSTPAAQSTTTTTAPSLFKLKP